MSAKITTRTSSRLKCKEVGAIESPISTPKRGKSKCNSEKIDIDIRNNIEVTPPKQKKIDNSKITSPGSSAASLITKLNIATPKSSQTKFQLAKQILNTNETKKLPGREREFDQILKFLDEHIKSKKSGSMYISGPPGTGKTACLSKILNSEEYLKQFKKVYINCTSTTSIGSIYKNIAEELNLSIQTKDAIEKFLKANHKIVLLVLDEIDQLIGQKQSVLYSIFEWPSIPNSKLVLIGIANALDLTDRMLPRLNTKCELKPILMHFAPYTKQQIIEIFTDRLKDAGVIDLFPPVTIQLLAGKVAAISGDVRRALDIGRRVVEIAEKQKYGRNKKVNIDLSDLGVAPLQTENDTVQMNQVVNVLNNVYGTSQALCDDIEDSFPLQQKIIICTLLLILKHDKNREITIGRLHDVYKKICKKRNVVPIEQSEVFGLCDLIETRGILRLQKKTEPRLCKISLQWDEEEVNQALKDKQLIAGILSDSSCLNKK